MRHLRIVIDIEFVAVVLGKPFTGEAKARVDADPLVRHVNRVSRRLIGNIETFFR